MSSKNKINKKSKTSQRIDETIYEMATGLYDIDVIDKKTMREFESLKLPEVKDLKPRQIKLIRLKEKTSQAVFARFLNVTVHTVRDWEQGKKHPRGSSLKLLNLVADKGLDILTQSNAFD